MTTEESEYILEPNKTTETGFWQFMNQVIQIDRRTQAVNEADPDNRHSGLILLVFFLGCAVIVFIPVLVLMWWAIPSLLP